MTKVIENLKASIIVSTLTENVSMYSQIGISFRGMSMAVCCFIALC